MSHIPAAAMPHAKAHEPASPEPAAPAPRRPLPWAALAVGGALAIGGAITAALLLRGTKPAKRGRGRPKRNVGPRKRKTAKAAAT